MQADPPRDPSSSSRRRWLALVSAGLTGSLGGCVTTGSTGSTPPPVDYAAAMRAALRTQAGDLAGWHVRSTPVGQFGVGSIYLDEAGDASLARAESGWYLGGPDTWLAVGAGERAGAMQRLVAEGSMGAFRVDDQQRRQAGAQAGIAILALFVARGSVDREAGVQTTFSARDLRQRRLNWAEFDTLLRANRLDPGVTRAVRDGRFVVAAADLVLTDYRAEITIDERANPQLAASMRTKALLPQLAGSAQASFRLQETSAGRFVAAANGPVVAAVLYKRPPPISKDRPGGARPPLDDWPAASVDPRALDAVEQRLIEQPRR